MSVTAVYNLHENEVLKLPLFQGSADFLMMPHLKGKLRGNT